jgi:hypothetical protein
VVCGLGEGAGAVWAAAFWASTQKEAKPRQSVKTAAMSFFMENNVTPIRNVRKQEQRFSCDDEVLVLPFF